ncbi:MAG: hypothetical protein QOC96_1282 [Acidobacteriota bacterium]|jgi:hypothetical protein|nr:hypothetical protein [Acidobacteriota bacterium]
MNNRIIGIVGGALLIIGIFLPLISVAGLLSFSSFFVITNAPIAGSWPLILIALCGVGGLLLALTNNYKALLAPGVIAIGCLVYSFIQMKSEMGSMGGPGATGAGADNELAQQMLATVSMGVGVYVMALGAIALIVAGVMKSPARVGNSGWGGAPPPYTPGS